MERARAEPRPEPEPPTPRGDSGAGGNGALAEADAAAPLSGTGDRTVDLDLSSAAVEGLIRPALEFAFEAVRRDARATPPVEPPRALVRYLGWKKLPAKALSVVRDVIDEDDGLRADVARGVDESVVGRAGWLWLARPDGWTEVLAGVVADAEQAAEDRGRQGEERRAGRRVAAAEAARDRAVAQGERARAELEEARGALSAERRSRRAADDQVVALVRRVGSLEAERDAARRRADEATAEAAQRDLTMAELELEARSARAELSGVRTEAADLRHTLATARSAAAPSEPAVDAAAVGHALARAARAAAGLGAALGEALGEAAAALSGSGAERAAPVPRYPRDPPPKAASPRPIRPRPRRAATLPPAVFDDSPEAAEHLVRLPGATVLVDGYNASIPTWPDLAISEQRRRLVDALDELAARTGVAIEVVFDGTNLVDRDVRAGSRRHVRVGFTAPDVEADDVLIARAAEVEVPVVVASDDRRVRDGSRRAGANVLSIAQLLGVLRRAG